MLRGDRSATGGRFFFAGDQKELEQIYGTIDSITPENHKTLSWRPKQELYMWPLGAGVLIVIAYQLVMAVLSLGRRGWRAADATAQWRPCGDGARAMKPA